MNTTDTYNEIKKHGVVTILNHNRPQKPSWKLYGNGRAIVEIRACPKWSDLDLHCVEVGETSKREVFVSLPVAQVVQLLQKLGYEVKRP